MSRSAIPATGAPPTIGLTPVTTARQAETASRMPGTARIGPIETTGLDGQIIMTSAPAIASATPRAAARRRCPARAPLVPHAGALVPPAAPHPVLLEMEVQLLAARATAVDP